MSDFVKKLIDLLEPTIVDLDDKINLLSQQRKNLDELTLLLEKVGDNVIKIGQYENQDLILNNLSLINSNENEYKACCYLLSSEDEKVRSLPQYMESFNYIARFISALEKRRDELRLEVSELDVVCNNKTANKKYLEIFKEENPVIYNADEFKDFLERQALSNSDKIDLLLYTIKNSVDRYKEERVKGR